MKRWIVWILSIAIAGTSSAQVPSGPVAPLTPQSFLSHFINKKKSTTVGEFADALLISWPSDARERWQSYLKTVRSEKLPSLTADGDRLLVNSPQGSLVIEFNDPEMQSMQINGQKIWTQDLLQVTAGIRQLEKIVEKRSIKSTIRGRGENKFPDEDSTLKLRSLGGVALQTILGEPAHAMGALAFLAIGALIAGSFPLMKWMGLFGGSSSGGGTSSSGRDQSSSTPAVSVASHAAANSAPRSDVMRRFSDAGSANRCAPYSSNANRMTANSACDVTAAISKYSLNFETSRKLFCGDSTFLSGISGRSGLNSAAIKAKVQEIERKYSSGLQSSLSSLYNGARSSAQQRDEKISRENFQNCLKIALEQELSGCNPNQPIEGVANAGTSGQSTELTLCPSAKRSNPPVGAVSVMNNEYGNALRIYTAVENGAVQPLHPCAIARGETYSCSEKGLTAPSPSRSERSTNGTQGRQ